MALFLFRNEGPEEKSPYACSSPSVWAARLLEELPLVAGFPMASRPWSDEPPGLFWTACWRSPRNAQMRISVLCCKKGWSSGRTGSSSVMSESQSEVVSSEDDSCSSIGVVISGSLMGLFMTVSSLMLARIRSPILSRTVSSGGVKAVTALTAALAGDVGI